ncbi:DUF4097 family beta strand repeat-containing protein [Kangiella sediminilitoris]|uniref:Uncharacterized protein n=1 Tax=Kangiella sediminilitoris TaxID=1144748 RepID=A0A1B3BCU6_9GAMM|nr:DUF4097 family beta strand repeat-containing protein [Kangiella sediminilitoris]AOE50644.1 hypothetical protein KS2013_1935 [Kangiella sediminilitoris]
MKTVKKWLGTVSMIALGLSSLAVTADESKSFSETYDFSENGSINLDNINGNIEVTGWDKEEILLEYTITADDEDDLDNIKVEIEHSEDDFDVEVDIDSGGFMSWGGSSGEVSFTLKVPHGVTLDSIESVNGNIEIEDVSGEIKAETVNGKIVIKNTAQDVKFGTVNGDVEVVVDTLSRSARIKGDSVNGDIDIYLPENDGFELSSDTVNGDLSNDFDIEVDEGEFVGADMNGEYKSGGASLKFDTVNGDISIHKK